VTEPYGVTVVEVSDPTLADVTLNMDGNSAVGGYADGVLGCTTDAGQITIITGWNFYAGSDATQIGPGQYDFRTVVTHELGHALGLGHSADNGSVMYATLAPGSAHRTLSTADLRVPDAESGPCGLHTLVVSAVGEGADGLAPSSSATGRGLLLVQPTAIRLNGLTAASHRPRIGVLPFSAVLAAEASQPGQDGGGAVLVGGDGRDLLVGGSVGDPLAGNPAADTPTPGTTAAYHDVKALDTLMMEWASGATAVDHGVLKGMTGSSLPDGFWANNDSLDGRADGSEKSTSP
jgi:hypothetical protein